MKDKFNKVEEKIDNVFKPRVGRTTFFVFYLIFFIVLALLIKFNNTSVVTNSDGQLLYSTEMIEKSDFKLEILINENNSTNTIITDNKSEFDFEYKELINIYNIRKLIKKSNLVTRDVKEDVITKLHYDLNSETLNNILNTNVEETSNTMTLYLNPNKQVYLIEMDLSNYMNKLKNDTSYILKIEYKFVEE